MCLLQYLIPSLCVFVCARVWTFTSHSAVSVSLKRFKPVSKVKDTVTFRLSSSLEGKASSPKASLKTKQESMSRQRRSPSSPSRGKYEANMKSLPLRWRWESCCCFKWIQNSVCLQRSFVCNRSQSVWSVSANCFVSVSQVCGSTQV